MSEMAARRRRSRTAAWVGAALLCGVVPLVLAGVVPWREVVASRDGADPLLQASILQHALRHVPWSEAFWDAPWFWPATRTMAYMDPMVGPSMLLRPLAWVGGDAWAGPGGAALAYNLVFVFDLAGSFLACAWLARRLGLPTVAAALGAAVVTLGPWSAGQWHHLNQLPAPWLPLALVALLSLRDAGDGASARRATLAWCAAFALQASWSLYATVALGFATVAFLVACPPRATVAKRHLWGIGLGAAAVLAVAALPFAAAERAVEGYGRGVEDVLRLQGRSFDLWKAPRAHLLPWPAHDPGRPVLYVGALWTVLAGFEVWRRRRERAWLALALVGLLSLLMAFGRSFLVPFTDWEIPLPFAALQDRVWPLQAIRGTARLSGPFALAVALLGSAGAWRLWSGSRRRSVAFAVVGLAMFELLPGPSPSVRVVPDAAEASMLAALGDTPEDSVWLDWPAPCRQREEVVGDARAMLWALWSGRPVAGGASGFVPPAIRSLRREVCEGDPERRRRALEAHGVTHLVWRDTEAWRCTPVDGASADLLSRGRAR